MRGWSVAVTLVAAGAFAFAQTTIPPGPTVVVLAGEYHDKTCPKLAGQTPQSMPLADALRAAAGPCGVCKPNNNREVGAFAREYAVPIGRELEAKRAAAAAEKRRADAAVAAAEKQRADEDAAVRRAETAARYKAEADRKLRAAEAAPPVTAALVKKLTTEAMAEAEGTAAVKVLDEKMHAIYGDFTTDMVPVNITCPKILAMIDGPYAAYRRELAERLRKMEPITGIIFTPGVAVHVTPTKIDDPDVVKIVVQRDGKIVLPLTTSLRPKVFTTALGGRAVLHSGAVTYPQAAFAPGATVTVIAIPEDGENCELKMPSSSAAWIR